MFGLPFDLFQCIALNSNVVKVLIRFPEYSLDFVNFCYWKSLRFESYTDHWLCDDTTSDLRVVLRYGHDDQGIHVEADTMAGNGRRQR